MIGKTFNSWTVLEEAGVSKRGLLYKCQCICENIGIVRRYALINNASIQCVICARTKYGKEMIGKSFNNWTIIKQLEKDSKGNVRYECQCKCGIIQIKLATKITTNRSKKCDDCLYKDICEPIEINKIYGNWKVLKELGADKNRALSFECECKCGSIRIKTAQVLREKRIEFCSECSTSVHKIGAKRNLKHGMCYTDTYKVWEGLFRRCYDEKSKQYKYYGGRGIKVHERWNEFENFLADIGERPQKDLQIDRINNDGDYEPGNCRWVTPKENSNNRRNSKKNKMKNQMELL